MTNSGLANFKAPKDKNSQPAGGAPKSEGTGVTKGCLGCLGLIVLIAVLFGGCAALSSGDDNPSSSDNKYEAIAQCEARIDRLLKAPSTADYNSDATGSGSGPWKVTGTVDAQNSFGAKVRATYGCTVTMSRDMATTAVDYFNE